MHRAATFLSSYIHTVIIYIALCIFMFTVYAGGSDLGSPKKVRNALSTATLLFAARLQALQSLMHDIPGHDAPRRQGDVGTHCMQWVGLCHAKQTRCSWKLV